jgi:hypothetical protein
VGQTRRIGGQAADSSRHTVEVWKKVVYATLLSSMRFMWVEISRSRS